jgi:very-short-patch-repair endonuclease
MLPYDKQLKAASQHLRRNMTDVENMLWFRLRRKQLKGLQFYRQKIIGKYIVDFYCPKANLVIELTADNTILRLAGQRTRQGTMVLSRWESRFSGFPTGKSLRILAE